MFKIGSFLTEGRPGPEPFKLVGFMGLRGREVERSRGYDLWLAEPHTEHRACLLQTGRNRYSCNKLLVRPPELENLSVCMDESVCVCTCTCVCM